MAYVTIVGAARLRPRQALLEVCAAPARGGLMLSDREARELGVHEDVLQAEGFVALQLGVELDEAAECLSRYAMAEGRTLPGVADDVLSGRVRFGSGPA